MTDLVLIARQRTPVDSRTHYHGCERKHVECLVQMMASEIERLQSAIEQCYADNHASVRAYAEEINEAKTEIELLRAEHAIDPCKDGSWSCW